MAIVPKPFSVTPTPGKFICGPATTIWTDSLSLSSANYLQHYIDSFYGLNLTVKLQAPPVPVQGIVLQENTGDSVSETYRLKITPAAVQVIGDAAGVFYGVQSIIQLLPADPKKEIVLSCGRIVDKPRFAWRGLSLDASRHFFSVAEVKKYIDLMAHYKLNRFHWHLTDDEGWRIQIDQYPLLTSVASKMNVWAAEKKFRPMTNIVDGGSEGFYTKNDIREVVAYANERHISVLPEIEMPGHCEAAVYAYPWLGCADSTGQKQKQLPWPRTRMYDVSDRVFQFLDSVLLEVMELFPFEYIHIGGDEAEMKDWLKSPSATALMKKEGLQNEKEVQSYFIRRMEKFLLAHHKKLIGWDEILEGGLAPSATVMSWRGEEGGIAAAKMGHPVVMTPLPYVYFDAPQSDDPTEPIGWNYPLSWQHVYEYNPVPSVLTAAEAPLVMGVQANIWAEKIPSDAHLEYMVYPRVIALAEDAWTPQNQKHLSSFTDRLNKQYHLLHLWKVNARMPDLKGPAEIVCSNMRDFVEEFSYPVRESKIYYTLDGSKPDSNSIQYAGPFLLHFNQADSVILRTLVTTRLSSQQRFQQAIIRRVSLGGPVDTTRLQGIRYQLFARQLEPDSLAKDSAYRMGSLPDISLPADSSASGFHTALISGVLDITHAGRFIFRIQSDGETLLKINGKEVLSNEGYHGTALRGTLLDLPAGRYPFSIWYGNEDQGRKLSLDIVPGPGAAGSIR